jgi:riboflavin synthase
MFTGIVGDQGATGKGDSDPQVEHTARVASISLPSPESGCTMIFDQSGPILEDCHIGDSICVNGTCLTVTKFDAGNGTFDVGLAPETLSRTNLGTRLLQ